MTEIKFKKTHDSHDTLVRTTADNEIKIEDK